MVEFEFYSNMYGGDSIPREEWPAVERDAAAKLEQYKRTYQVAEPAPDGENKAVCAMADCLYYFQVAQSGGIAASVSVGSVSCSRDQTSLPDMSAKAQAAELYRSAKLYLDIFRG